MNQLLRSLFPSLSRTYHNRPIVHLDGPAGTQVPQSVINAITHVYAHSNANTHGQFITSQETDDLMSHARSQVATLLGSENGNTISFGANTTTLNFFLANVIGRSLQAGDEIIISQLDHEANRGPWLNQKRHGIIIKEIALLENGTLDYTDLENKITSKTKVIAVGLASNIFGTINEIAQIQRLAHKAGALLIFDAVHFVPHMLTDVQKMDCDFLLCSAYKFYGPHVGILYSKPGSLEKLDTDHLRVQEQKAPYLIETGTLNHPAIAGVSEAVDFMSSIGEGNTLREKIVSAYAIIQNHEHTLAEKLYIGLQQINGIKIYGPPFDQHLRAPTISFTVKNKSAEQVCKELAANSICAWDGHFYAIRAAEVLGLLDKGGVTRLGIALYNLPEEIDFTIKVLSQIANN